MRTRDLLCAVLQAGAFAYFLVYLVRAGALWIWASAQDRESGMATWSALAPAVGALFALAVLVLAPRIARTARDGVAIDTDLRRAIEVVAGIWCLGAAFRHATVFVPRPELFHEFDFVLEPETWGVGWRVPLYAVLTAVLLVGPGRIGRWIHKTFGPIPIRD